MRSVTAKTWLSITLSIASVWCPPPEVRASVVADFDDLPLAPDSYWNGADGSGSFGSGTALFFNNYNPTWGSWDGWAYTNRTDTATPGFLNQYSAFAGGGQSGSANYAVAYDASEAFATSPPRLVPNDGAPTALAGIWLTNTTYAALSMLHGDAFAKKFGGPTGNDPDWFKLAITGYDTNAGRRGTVDFYLADYRFNEHALDYIVDDWTWLDLSGLGEVAAVEFQLSSSDNSEFGMNTPACFAMDSLGFGPDLLPGDTNGDGHVDEVDIAPFVAVVLGSVYQVEGDMNRDGYVNGLDVDRFAAAVSGAGGLARAVPEPTSIILAGIALLVLFIQAGGGGASFFRRSWR